MGGGSVRKRLSRRIPGSFLLRRSLSSPPPNQNPNPNRNCVQHVEDVEDRRPYGREDSGASRFSSASNNSISTVSLSSGSSNQHNGSPMSGMTVDSTTATVTENNRASTKLKASSTGRGFTGSNSNWLFSESFCQPTYTAPVDPRVDPRGIPCSTHEQLVLKLWTITVKGFLYEKMTGFEKDWLRNLPQDAQKAITNLYQQITIFDYENAAFDVETNTSYLPLIAEAATAPTPTDNTNTTTIQTLPTSSETLPNPNPNRNPNPTCNSNRNPTCNPNPNSSNSPRIQPKQLQTKPKSNPKSEPGNSQSQSQSQLESDDDTKIGLISKGDTAESGPVSVSVSMTESKCDEDQPKRKPLLFRSPSLSPRSGVSRQGSGLERRAMFIEKRSLSGRLSFPSSKVSKKTQSRTHVLDLANCELERFGLKAVLCKHESHYIGGSIVLSYYIRLEKEGQRGKGKRRGTGIGIGIGIGVGKGRKGECVGHRQQRGFQLSAIKNTLDRVETS